MNPKTSSARVLVNPAGTEIGRRNTILWGRAKKYYVYEGDRRLDDVARAACVSPYHFHRLFRGVFGETPNEYLQRKRLMRAGELLKTMEATVIDISLAVGFESSTSFAALFRRVHGCSPRKYRTAAQTKK